MRRMIYLALALVVASLSPGHAQGITRICVESIGANGSNNCTDVIPGQLPAGIGVSASATGTTGAIAATLPAVAGKTTYICGFYYTGTNTSAPASFTLTITGTIGGTLNFGFSTLTAAATTQNPIPIDEAFAPCIAASAPNTAIVVNGPALGTGATLATVTSWGYQF